MGVMNETVEDGVGIGRVADQSMPFVDGDLAGEDRRAASVTFLKDLIEVTTGPASSGSRPQSSRDQELDAGEAAQDAGVAAVTAGERELGKDLRDPLIEDRAIVTAGFVSQGTGKPTFADPGGPAQDQIVVCVDPFAIGKVVEQSAVEAARGPVIDVLDGGLLTRSGIAQSRGQPLVAAMGELAIE